MPVFLLCYAIRMKDYQSRQAVHELGGIPQLLELLNSEFPVIQHLALRTLQNVTTDKDTRNTFREEQGFEKLMDILSNAVGLCSREKTCFCCDTLIYASCCPVVLIKCNEEFEIIANVCIIKYKKVSFESALVLTS